MSQDEPLLSICIPTYNRAELLGKCLSAIYKLNLTIKFEVVISDNCSSDETSQIVIAFGRHGLPIRYFKNDQNLGIDRNIQLVVEKARGKWIHLLSDDDYILPQYEIELLNVIENTNRQPFIFLNLQVFRIDRNDTIWNSPRFNDSIDNQVFSDQVKFLEKIGVYGTFISSFVFTRELWLRVDGASNFIGTDIYLTYAMLGYISSSRESIFVSKPLIAVRAEYSGNYRILRAFSKELSNAYCSFFPSLGHSKYKLHRIYSKIIISDLIKRIISIKIQSNDSKFQSESWFKEVVVPQSRFPVAWVTIYPIILTPPSVFRALRAIKRFFRKNLS